MINAAPAMLASEFMRELYPGELTAYLTLFRVDTEIARFTKSFADVDDFATASVRENFNAYFEVCLQRQVRKGRGNSAGAYVMPGVWADIDFAGKSNPEAKRSKRYPPREVVEDVLSRMPTTTFLVSTGGGLHGYWLFDEPLLIVNEEIRFRAKHLVQAWQGMLRAAFLKAGGFALDSTHDLARLLRIPGSIHAKYPDRRVHVEQFSGERYSLKAIEERVSPEPSATNNVAKRTSRAKAEVAAARPLASETSEPPAAKLENLLEVNLDCRRLYKERHKDDGDISPSGYDMSLALFFVNAGWTDDEVAAGLVSFARLHHPDHLAKLLRVDSRGQQDYLLLTIANAHKRAAESSAPRDSPLGNKAYELGELKLTVANIHPTPRRLTVMLEVHVDGKCIDILKISDAISSRKGAVSLLQRLDHGADEGDLERLLGTILVDARRAPPPVTSGKTVFVMLMELIPRRMTFTHRCGNGRAHCHEFGELSRANFLEIVLSNSTLGELVFASDAPRSDGVVDRAKLQARAEKELKLCWGQLMQDLPDLSGASVEPTSQLAIDFRSSLLKMWTRPVTMGFVRRTEVQLDLSVQLTESMSLAARVRRMELANCISDSWQQIHPGYSAYVRHVLNDHGPPTIFLGMRFDLADQVRIPLSSVNDQAALQRLGSKFGVLDAHPPVPLHADRGQLRLVILSPDLTEEILYVPQGVTSAQPKSDTDVEAPT